MSLINQMLQELDARGNPAAMGGVLQGQVRAVPQRRGLHPAWLLTGVLGCLLCAGGLWVWLGGMTSFHPHEAAKPLTPSVAALSFKIDKGMDVEPGATSPTVPASVLASPSPSASALTSAPAPASVTALAASPRHDQALSVNGIPSPVSPTRSLSLSEGAHPKNMELNRPEAESPTASAREAQPVKSPAGGAALQAGAPMADNAVIAKHVKELTPRQLAENEYRKASGLIQQGRSGEAVSSLEQALQLDNRHVEARQTLAALLIQLRRQDEAMRILREGLQLDASQSGLAMILARLQLERGELKPAIDTLQRSLPHAAERADYLAFLAALLQRDGRHREAIDYYTQALRKSPGNSVWWMGQGISLQAENRIPEAIEAFKRAKAGNGLSAELKAFVDDRLNSL